ncbi:hypothetical protein LTR56_019993 [Elasticomyces elasticus]|nr:hypothetical protein LTR56_019993 [Elasticomyces elasticus]KAK3634102.1 hypothetical protein LTR22_019834 [Elasticomyces elasticus]KAK4911187.1 hypothetical protein LTR49_020259 [Elasticomyces elasticus]KAK5748024.1 hypothetical protein LTS12_021953 [Elasticomyces elasticus]
MGNKPRLELLGALRSLHASHDYSDLVILSRDGSSYQVHRAIVCPRSSYIDRAVKKGKWLNGLAGQIELREDDPDVVEKLVDYFYLLDYSSSESRSTFEEDTASVMTEPIQYECVYGTPAVRAFGGPEYTQSSSSAMLAYRGGTGSLLAAPSVFSPFASEPSSGRRATSGATPAVSSPKPSNLATSEPDLTLHTRMYAAGYKYDVSGLKALALGKFKIQLTRHWDTPEFAEALYLIHRTT